MSVPGQEGECPLSVENEGSFRPFILLLVERASTIIYLFALVGSRKKGENQDKS